MLLLLAGATRAPGEPPGGSGATAPVTTVVAHGWTDRDTVRSGDRIRFWIVLANRTGGPVRELRFVRFWQPGLKRAGKGGHGRSCWSAGGPVCVEDATGSALPMALDAGDRLVVTAELDAGREPGSFVPTGIFSWKDLGGGAHEGVLHLPPIRVAGRWSAFDRGLVGLIKDLALPIVLLLLGVWFRFGEQRRAAVQETWNQMLQNSHENAEHQYMPVSSALARLRTSLERYEGNLDGRWQDWLDQLFLDLILFSHRMHRLLQAIGGFYFKSREGEDLTSSAWGAIRKGCERHLGRLELESLLSRFGEVAGPADIQRRIARRGAAPHPPGRTETGVAGVADDLRRRFEAWFRSGGFRPYEALMGLLELLLDFEMNRPYERWYRRRERFPRAEFLARLQRFKTSIAEPRDTEEDLELLAGQLRRYAWRGGRSGLAAIPAWGATLVVAGGGLLRRAWSGRTGSRPSRGGPALSPR